MITLPIPSLISAATKLPRVLAKETMRSLDKELKGVQGASWSCANVMMPCFNSQQPSCPG